MFNLFSCVSRCNPLYSFEPVLDFYDLSYHSIIYVIHVYISPELFMLMLIHRQKYSGINKSSFHRLAWDLKLPKIASSQSITSKSQPPSCFLVLLNRHTACTCIYKIAGGDAMRCVYIYPRNWRKSITLTPEQVDITNRVFACITLKMELLCPALHADLKEKQCQ